MSPPSGSCSVVACHTKPNCEKNDDPALAPPLQPSPVTSRNTKNEKQLRSHASKDLHPHRSSLPCLLQPNTQILEIMGYCANHKQANSILERLSRTTKNPVPNGAAPSAGGAAPTHEVTGSPSSHGGGDGGGGGGGATPEHFRPFSAAEGKKFNAGMQSAARVISNKRVFTSLQVLHCRGLIDFFWLTPPCKIHYPRVEVTGRQSLGAGRVMTCTKRKRGVQARFDLSKASSSSSTLVFIERLPQGGTNARIRPRFSNEGFPLPMK